MKLNVLINFLLYQINSHIFFFVNHNHSKERERKKGNKK